MEIIHLMFSENTSQKKPLIPNTTKVLKTKKLKFQKKFNPKNVCCAFTTKFTCYVKQYFQKTANKNKWDN
jgi:hypothetical protein